MAQVEHEVYDTEIIEAVGTVFQSCVFFDCQFSGVGNVFRDCRFRFSGAASFPMKSLVVDCLIEVNQLMDFFKGSDN